MMIQSLRWVRDTYRYAYVAGITGLFKALSGAVTNSKAFHTLKRNDCKHPFQVRIPSSDVPTYEQVFIQREYDFSVNEEPRVIVDAGANIGLASIYFANKFPNATIIAIEPEQSNFELLQANVAAYPNVVPIQAALWDKNEEINLVDPGLGNWGFMAEEGDSAEPTAGKSCHAVPAMTVEKIMQDYDLQKIDILKVDIEGAEKEVFRNTSSWIEKVDSLIVELHERMKAGCNRSFYCGSNGFDDEWNQGENVYLSRRNCLARRTT